MIGINLEIKTQLDNLDKSVKDIVQNQNTKTILQKARFFIQKFIQQINIIILYQELILKKI